MKIGLIFSVKSSYRSHWYIQNQWIVFLARSNWLLKLGIVSVKSSYRSDWYIQNQWIVFFARSDWLLKLGIVSAIHLPAFCWISRASFASFHRKRNNLVLAVSTGLVLY